MYIMGNYFFKFSPYSFTLKGTRKNYMIKNGKEIEEIRKEIKQLKEEIKQLEIEVNEYKEIQKD